MPIGSGVGGSQEACLRSVDMEIPTSVVVAAAAVAIAVIVIENK